MIKLVALLVAVASASNIPKDYRHKSPLLPDDLFIIGGHPAEPHAYPWQISLQVRRSGAWGHNCGGSIVDENTVVTAAHCCYGHNAADMQIVAGAQFLSKDEDNSKQTVTLSNLIIHEDYDPNSLGINDICLIKVESPFSFDEAVAPATLPKQDEQPEDLVDCENSGWGNTNQNGVHNPDELQVVVTPVIPQDVCEDLWSKHGMHINDGNICSGEKNKGCCNGDSGGPLMCPSESGDKTMHGIVSWGHVPCGQAEYPGVFTRTAHFMDWIEEHLWFKPI